MAVLKRPESLSKKNYTIFKIDQNIMRNDKINFNS